MNARIILVRLLRCIYQYNYIVINTFESSANGLLKFTVKNRLCIIFQRGSRIAIASFGLQTHQDFGQRGHKHKFGI